MLSIIPKPQHVQTLPGRLLLNSDSIIIAAPAQLTQEAACLTDRIEAYFQWKPCVASENAAAANVTLALDDNIEHAEGYRLQIDASGITITGKTSAGVFYGCQSLLQILTQAHGTGNGIELTLPNVRIEDQPRFAWRGLMMDVSRHFFTAQQVCRFLDLMALHKFNIFHWHLTDDQGWRLPVEKYPRLTEIGSWRKQTVVGHDQSRPRRYDQTPYGGHYTRQEIQQVVAHAERLHITVVPEIDMPGHMQAAITAYPELGNGLGPLDVRCHWGISQHILNPRESTIQFMQNVLREVMDLFPGRFIHIGGDEAHKHEWAESPAAQQRMAELGLQNENELQSWFIGRMATFLAEHGRRLIGWDEILEGGLPSGCAVMSWRGVDGGIAAATAGHDVVMTPWSHTYLDRNQMSIENEPLAIGGLNTLQNVYGFDPIAAALAKDRQHHVLGGQGQLWSEYILNMGHLEYMAFPRACALAEVLWSAEDSRNWNDFLARLWQHRSLLDQHQVRYGPIPEPAHHIAVTQGKRELLSCT